MLIILVIYKYICLYKLQKRNKLGCLYRFIRPCVCFYSYIVQQLMITGKVMYKHMRWSTQIILCSCWLIVYVGQFPRKFLVGSWYLLYVFYKYLAIEIAGQLCFISLLNLIFYLALTSSKCIFQFYLLSGTKKDVKKIYKYFCREIFSFQSINDTTAKTCNLLYTLMEMALQIILKLNSNCLI